MWDYVGIVRTTEAPGTRPAADNHAPTRNRRNYGHFRVSNDLLELRNLVQVAELIVRCAMMREESQGAGG
ncbi:hypothetical protein ACNKHV_16340 [Shigella flexneri]